MHTLRAALVAALALLAPALPAAAQVESTGTSYITPFPEGDVYKLQTYGDAFAEGLLAGLNEAFAGDARLQISRRHRNISGLARGEFEDEMRAEEAPGRETFHIGVIMLGIGDRVHMRLSPRDRVILGSNEWREEYARRVDTLIKTLRKKGMALYWVGQPVMRRYEANDPAQTMNDIVRDRTFLNGVKFIDIQAHFADEGGNFTPYGPDITGKRVLLREPDGVLFTAAGNRKLAHFVEQEIKRDLNQAKNARAIPLAGNEAEQKRINAMRPRPQPPGEDGWRGTVNPSKDDKAGQQRGAPEGSNELKADNGRITLRSVSPSGREESVTIDLLRPAIPSAVIALVTRKESADKPTQMGDVLAEDVGGGLVVQSSITPAGAGAPGGRRASPSLAPYYQVLIKGERLPPKPGRADDFSWPKLEPEMAPEPPVRRPQRAPRTASPRS